MNHKNYYAETKKLSEKEQVDFHMFPLFPVYS